VETHAIQLGSAWQVETWAPADILKTSLATHDVLGMKRAAQELSRLALGFRKTMPRLPGADVLRVIADHLVASVEPAS
jgi:hypothetical protein